MLDAEELDWRTLKSENECAGLHERFASKMFATTEELKQAGLIISKIWLQKSIVMDHKD